MDLSITPEYVPIKESVTVTEVVCQQLTQDNGQPDEEAAIKIRNKIVGILQNAKPPKSNINKSERQDLNPSKRVKISPYCRQTRVKQW